jgi:hypothetical protein
MRYSAKDGSLLGERVPKSLSSLLRYYPLTIFLVCLLKSQKYGLGGRRGAEQVTCIWIQMGLKVESSSPVVGDFSCDRRSIQGRNCIQLK